MEKACKNCEYFVQVSMDLSTYVWGDCRKPASGLERVKGDKKIVFKWDNGTCPDFKPKKEVEEKPDESILRFLTRRL